MKKGFSLVELSIVLVILGLLVGGILAGQSLIRASELRAVSRELQQYTTATYAFRDKYFAWPGDFATATNFWGTTASCPGDTSTPSTTIATCNGNGDSKVQHTTSTSNERYRFWQHLANAGLVEGTYPGVEYGSDKLIGMVGWNIPASKLSSGGWTPAYVGPIPAGDNQYYEASHQNIFFFGANQTNSGAAKRLMKPEEAWNIDSKLDDGTAGLGKVQSFMRAFSAAPSCATTTDAATAQYDLQRTDQACSLIFSKIF